MKALCSLCGKPTTVDEDAINELVTGVRHNECHARLELRRTVRPVNQLARKLIEERAGKAPAPSVEMVAWTIASRVRLFPPPLDMIGVAMRMRQGVAT